ncbi:hypothetical protein [Tautonia sociabilis]|nr:hypothetical protein [Tautonia sociabilis]
MKLDETEGHICMGAGEVKPGDRVTLFKNQCTGPTPGKKVVSPACKRQQLGGGEVIRTLNEHYSVIRVDPGVQFEVGTMVEKL